MARFLILLGLILILLGLLWPLLAKLGLGRLPGDIVVERDNLRIYIPLASALLVSVLLSVLLTILFWFWNR